jgi:hypothetical protein
MEAAWKVIQLKRKRSGDTPGFHEGAGCAFFALRFAWRTESSINDLTRILDGIGQDHAWAAAQLMPLVYDELRLSREWRRDKEINSPG